MKNLAPADNQARSPQPIHTAHTSARWWMLAGVAGFALVSYFERVNISITAELMIPALGLTRVQMGEIFTSFLIGYGLFQLPGGMAGDRFGPRITLTVSALIWAVATCLTGLLPALLRARVFGTFVALWSVRFVLGLAEATTFPVANRVVRTWIPPSQRALGNAVVFLGTSLASATAGPLVSWLMLRVGWQRAFYLCSLPALTIAALWYLFAGDRPSETIAEEVAWNSRWRAGETPSLFSLLRQRNVILLVASYVSEGYVLFIFVFWLYIYLVERRGFTMMRGGWASSLPWLMALLVSPLGGIACDRISRSRGRLGGAKVVIIIGYALSGAALFLAAYAASPWASLFALSLSITFLMSAESSFWVSAAYLGGERVGALSGVMNTAGIVGGIASTMLVPVLAQHFGWLAAFGSGAFMALLCVLLAAALAEKTPSQSSGCSPSS